MLHQGVGREEISDLLHSDIGKYILIKDGSNLTQSNSWSRFIVLFLRVKPTQPPFRLFWDRIVCGCLHSLRRRKK